MLKHRSHDSDPRWSLERAKRDGATKPFDDKLPKLEPTARNDKPHNDQGKFTKGKSK